jgi:hypothetical protein
MRGENPASRQAFSSTARSPLSRVSAIIGSSRSVASGRSCGGRGVVGADAERQRLGGDHARVDGRRRPARGADEGHVDLAVAERLEQRLVVLLGDADADRRMRAVELAECRGEAAVHRPHDTHPQAPCEQAAQRHDRVAAPLGRGQRRARMREERLARAGQPHAALVAVARAARRARARAGAAGR